MCIYYVGGWVVGWVGVGVGVGVGVWMWWELAQSYTALTRQ